MRGIAVTLACFALVAALLAWSRWLARRRLASLGHVALAAACTAAAIFLWSAAGGMASYEPLRPGHAIAEIRFDQVGPGRYRATLIRLPWGQVQLFEMTGENWRLEARTLRWHGLAADLGLKPVYRLERLECGPAAGDNADRSYTLAHGEGMDVWTRARGNAVWSPYAEAAVAAVPWKAMKDGSEFTIIVTPEGLVAQPSGTEIPILPPPRG
ncbi:MAG: hypothetical protein MUO39_14235 [Steroidobacteraceae bacterium]|nr:hypothetical protein [Steroidobacteraceae bacterium]